MESLQRAGIDGTAHLYTFSGGEDRKVFICKRCKKTVMPSFVMDKDGALHPVCDECFWMACETDDRNVEWALPGLAKTEAQCELVACVNTATSVCKECAQQFCEDCMAVPGKQGICMACANNAVAQAMIGDMD